MEGYQCNFNDKNMDDVVDFISEDLNPYMDKCWKSEYSAYLLSPFLRSANESNFDFGWVGFNDHEGYGIYKIHGSQDEAASNMSTRDSISDLVLKDTIWLLKLEVKNIPLNKILGN